MFPFDSPENIRKRKVSLFQCFHWVQNIGMKRVNDHDDEMLSVVKPYFQPGSLSDVLTIATVQHAADRI